MWRGPTACSVASGACVSRPAALACSIPSQRSRNACENPNRGTQAAVAVPGRSVARGALVQRSVVRVAAGWWAAGSTAVNNSRDCADPEDDGARSRVILVDGRDDLGDGKEPKAAVLSLPLQPRIALRCCMFGAACCAASCTSQARSYHRRKSHDASGTNSEWIWAQPRAAAALMAMRALAGTAASSRTRCEQA
jgi:hypothetical protein